MFTVTTLHSIS